MHRERKILIELNFGDFFCDSWNDNYLLVEGSFVREHFVLSLADRWLIVIGIIITKHPMLHGKIMINVIIILSNTYETRSGCKKQIQLKLSEFVVCKALCTRHFDHVLSDNSVKF